MAVQLKRGEPSRRVDTHGAAAWMAPEVLSRGAASSAADVYSFGVLLWQMVTGRVPWGGLGAAAVVHAVCVEGRALGFDEECSAEPAAADSVPDCLRLLARACMAADPRERPGFSEILEILEPLGRLGCAAP